MKTNNPNRTPAHGDRDALVRLHIPAARMKQQAMMPIRLTPDIEMTCRTSTPQSAFLPALGEVRPRHRLATQQAAEQAARQMAGEEVRKARLHHRGNAEDSKMDVDEARIEAEMREAVAAYDGPVTRYRPGRARGKPVKRPKLPPPVLPSIPKLNVEAERKFMKVDGAARWLRRHAKDRPVEDPKERRRRKRMARAERKRIAQRNAALLKGRNLSK